MKSYELQPTMENIKQTYLMDSIGRNDALHCFVDALGAIEDCCSIALDGDWGSGKTFFIHQAKMLLDMLNPYITIYDSERDDQVQKTWQKVHPSADEKNPVPQISVYFDAWQYDNMDDPLLSLIYEIDSQVKTDHSFKEEWEPQPLIDAILDFVTPENVSALLASMRRKDRLEEIGKAQKMQSVIKNFFDSMLVEQGERLVIFIDELDRCRPGYAVTLLERIKHYFVHDRITFVFSVNLYELQGTIKHFYGTEFNACRYLDRFFHLRMALPPVDIEQYVKSFGFLQEQYLYDVVAYAVMKRYHFQLRDISKYILLLRIADNKRAHARTSDFQVITAESFCLTTIVPILIGLKIADINEYKDFIEGKDGTPFEEIIPEHPLYKYFFDGLLEQNEGYTNQTNKQKVVRVEDKLQAVYKALFSNTTSYNRIRIGRYEFTLDLRNKIMQTANLLSHLSDFHMEE